MKLLLISFFVLICSLTVWADIAPPPSDFPQPTPSPASTAEPITVEIPTKTPQPEKTGTCAGVFLLTIGIVLLGRWVIRRNEFGWKVQNAE